MVWLTDPMVRGVVLSVSFVFGFLPCTANADFLFGQPANLGPLINSSQSDFTACISADSLSLFFASNRPPGGFQDFDLWVVTRPTKDDNWGTPEHLGGTLNSRQNEWTPFLSENGLELYYAQGPWGNTDIVVSKRESLSEPWGRPESLGPAINSGSWDGSPFITADGLELYFYSSRSGNPDLYVSTRATTAEPWGTATSLGPVVNSTDGNALYGEHGPFVSPDGLTLFFSSARSPGSANSMKIWMTKRATREDAWQSPVLLGPPVNGTASDWVACVSADGQMFYFISNRPGGYGGDSDFWQASIVPLVDFDGDGKVDGREVLSMAEHWGQIDPLCDIGPFAWGDGVVDVEDLTVLARYIGKEVDDPTLLAHWALDEVEGDTAYDGAAANDARLLGNPTWKPDAGIVDGALELDGLDDGIVSDFVLDPGDGPFSASVWVNSKVAGGVILSQGNGSNWLLIDSTDGSLMTELRHTGRTPQRLQSHAIITDGQWHRIRLVWDGSNRILYVDDVEVAFDAPGAVADYSEGLHIGYGADQSAGSFFSGLIDDVRIYNRAVRP